jgi:hypothetical protein
MEGFTSYTVSYKQTGYMCRSWPEAGEEGRRLYRRWVGRRVFHNMNRGRDRQLTDLLLVLWGWLIRRDIRNRLLLLPGNREGIRIEFL